MKSLTFVKSKLSFYIGAGFAIFILYYSFQSCSPNCSNHSEPTSQEFQYFNKNPKVIDVEYKFRITLDSTEINKNADLKVWIPIPRNWDTQKVVQVSKIEPKCDKDYHDPEHGNRILFWDFGNYPEAESYEISVSFRLENFQTYTNDSIIIQDAIPYDKNSKEYRLYTRDTKRIHISPQIIEMSKEAVGDETNPYLQAQAIFQYVSEKMRYRMHRKERGVGTDVLLNNPVVNSATGDTYFEGACGQFHSLFVALCRACGIPARPVVGFIQGITDFEEEDLKVFSPMEFELSSAGYAGTQHYFRSDKGMTTMPHAWAEFLISGYGWIPVDLNIGRSLGYLMFPRIVMSKGFDIQFAPEFNADELRDYGFQWIPQENGRVDILQSGVWNLSKLRNVSVKIFYSTDPFPSEGYFKYANNLISEENNFEKINNWKRQTLRDFYYASMNSVEANIFQMNAEFKKDFDAYLCHLIHYNVGDDAFKKIGDSYINNRINSNTSISINSFQHIIDSICPNTIQVNKWISNCELPNFRLENINLSQVDDTYRIDGYLLSERASIFNTPVELGIQSSHGSEVHKVNLTSDSLYFCFTTKYPPQKMEVDPNLHFPTIRWMPPLLNQLWDGYPDIIVIYGSIKEEVANRNTAMTFIQEFAGLSPELVKKDSEATEIDLDNKTIILIGRPETNIFSQRYEDAFPIKFNDSSAFYKNKSYNNPSTGVVQIIENAKRKNGKIIMYAGLSSSATDIICNKENWRKVLDGNFLIDYPRSFIIYNDYKIIHSGEWDDNSSNMVWSFNTEAIFD